jgi:ubiquinone/menaquinone biosynthesis C-methylase UbiE
MPLPAPFACPRCGGDLEEDAEAVVCGSCGPVGRRTLGHLDFTPGVGTIALAAGGTFDLAADEALATAALAAGTTAAQLFDHVVDANAWEHTDDPVERRAVARAAQRYERVEAEAGDRHGDAILDKVSAAWGSTVPSRPGHTIAVEAGGGFGRYLVGFRRHFDEVVFVDCSLANIVVAEQLAREQGVDGVTFVRADVTALPIASGSVDFVHQNGVIEHVADPVAMIEESLRVTRPDGVYACLSPNRYPITREPHFEVRLFGIYPPAIRRRVIRRTRGITSEAGTDLRSLRQLRAAFRKAGRPVRPFFLPPRLPSIARHTPVRRAVQAALDRPAVNRIVRGVVNGPVLPVMPYHLVVTEGRGA